jgi:hypothetical protein
MNFWPQMLGAFGRAAPQAFDFRGADHTLAARGWTFTADPRRAPEFLDVADASSHGVGLTGSGLTTVTTAPYFGSGETLALAGAVESSATADGDGRITFTVDLGPPHQFQQYTPAARALEAAGGYFESRTITFATR